MGDVRALFTRYGERYMAADAEAVADMCEAPFLAVRGGKPIHLPDRAALVEHFGGVMAAYRQSGAQAAEIVNIDVLEQGDSAVLATLRWNVRSAGGDLIRELWTSYQLVGPSPWRIVSYVNHDAVRPAGDTTATQESR